MPPKCTKMLRLGIYGTQISLNFRYPTRFSSRKHVSHFRSFLIAVDMFLRFCRPILKACEFKTNPFWNQPTCNFSFHFFQGKLARIMVKIYRFWIVFIELFYDSECKNLRVKGFVPVQPRPILTRKCNLFSSVSVNDIVFSFNQRTSFTFRCISVVIFISKASNNA